MNIDYFQIHRQPRFPALSGLGDTSVSQGNPLVPIPSTAECTSCCGYSNWPAAMFEGNCVKGAPVCPDGCWYLRAGPTCPATIGDCNNPNNQSWDCDMFRLYGDAVFPPPSIRDSVCGDAGTAAQYYGPWDPTRTYQPGDTVWDTCGQLFSMVSGGRWFKQGETVIGAGKIGTTGCVGPMGTSDMSPSWLSDITKNSAPWFSQPGPGVAAAQAAAAQAGSPAGASGPAVSGALPLSGSIQGAGGVPATGTINLPPASAAPSSGLIPGVPNWALIAGAVVVGFMMLGRH